MKTMKIKSIETEGYTNNLNPDTSKLIIELVQEGYLYTQASILEALSKQDVYISQSTLSRYLRNLDIVKNQKGKPYQISSKSLFRMHVDTLQSLIEENEPILYSNVSVQLVQVGSGMSSVYAHHLQEAFPEVLLEVEIKKNALLLYINLDVETDTFFELLHQMKEE